MDHHTRTHQTSRGGAESENSGNDHSGNDRSGISHSGIDRRGFLAGGLSVVGGGAVGLSGWGKQAKAAPAETSYAMPGPYPGRVIEVKHPGSVVNGEFRRDPVDKMIARGMMELTGADDATSAWRSMFSRGDVVGVKVNPVGRPLAISQYITIHAVVDSLKSAGVRARDIIVFERYWDEFVKAKYDKHLPEGVRSDAASKVANAIQLDMDGYDPDVFAYMEFINKGVHDPKDDRTRRSHLCKIVSKQINKLVCIPVLKDHGSAGVTGALKNMSHGLVNNVARSHSSADTNTCNVFIPTACSLKPIRAKAVLQIMDGLVGAFEGGPFTSRKNKKFTWPYRSYLFATDPVAMDRVEWDLIDKKRKAMSLPPVANTGKKGVDPREQEGFDIRQPQHIMIAGGLGLGIDDLEKIEHRKIVLGG